MGRIREHHQVADTPAMGVLINIDEVGEFSDTESPFTTTLTKVGLGAQNGRSEGTYQTGKKWAGS